MIAILCQGELNKGADVDNENLSFETRAVHAGLQSRVDGVTATVAPIVPSTTYTYASVEDVHAALGPQPEGFAYARNANPTVTALESRLAMLEGSEETVAFGSGMAALHAALVACNLEAGDSVLAGADLYGVTRSLLQSFASYDIQVHFVDVMDLTETESALARHKPSTLLFESITNPLMRVPDTSALVQMAHAAGARTIVDNTFATPYLFRPISIGADMVVHSVTKYLAGHGDVTAGVIATNRSFAARARHTRTLIGGVLSPFEAWLTSRGVRTLPLRMERHCANAAQLAKWLEQQSWVDEVYYPGLDRNPQRGLAAHQFDGRFGGMLAFDLCGGQQDALRFLNQLNVITTGTSLGDVESLALYPPLSSHRRLSEGELAAMGIGQGLIRMSVGLEGVADLQRDLGRAAETLTAMRAKADSHAV